MRLRYYQIAAIALFASGCTTVPAPIVDMEGVDPVKYNRDLADCYHHAPTLAAGNPITKCMADKNYRILYGL